jgi:hypothetical protein
VCHPARDEPALRHPGGQPSKAAKATVKMATNTTIKTKRLGHAVNSLFSPGAYRGQRADGEAIPRAATPLVALRLAQAYQELSQWNVPATLFRPGEKCTPDFLCFLAI